MSEVKKKVIFILLIYLLVVPFRVGAAVDSDGDGLSDREEVEVYYTGSQNPDSDGDGYPDGLEIKNHYSPHKANKTLSQTDFDGDGMSDWLELLFKTDLGKKDTDGDGFDDFTEINHAFDPLSSSPKKLPQKIVINTANQTLTPYLNGIPLAVFPVSTGKRGYETPVGKYKINNKVKRAWSHRYGLWMPYWMSFIGSLYGIHELPEWPGGIKEGADHLGRPVSHGCVRLGVGPAEWLYNWADIGTEVEVVDR